ncbi:MAG: hypothetical protein HYX87_09235 [Chloroflexi bacterium]|nr:hypothetical protein [Chloroflexota bacterium]
MRFNKRLGKGDVMNKRLELRLEKIRHSLQQAAPGVRQLSDDELAQIITGNPKARAGDITDAQLEAISRGATGIMPH